MAQKIYLGGVSGRPGSYGIVFPDFLGCVSVRETLVKWLPWAVKLYNCMSIAWSRTVI